MLNQFIVTAVIALLVFLFIWFKTRNLDSYMQNQILIMLSPTLICTIIGGTIGIPGFAIVGLIFSGILWYWFFVLRFPKAYRDAIKQVRMQNWNAAFEPLNLTVSENPDLWEAHQLRALVNSALGYFTNAEKDARKAIELKPQYSINHQTLGLVYWQQGEVQQAQYAYLKAYQILPKAPQNAFSLGVSFYKLGAYTDAEKYLSQAAKAKNIARLITPQNCLILYFYLAKIYEHLGQDDKKQKSLKKLKKYKDNIGALREQGKNDPPALKKLVEDDMIEIEHLLNSM